jgi:glycosyltransferase involved in cell wall biosynthesis
VKVALVHPTYFPEVRRGSERIVRDLANDLAARGHRARVVTSHPGRPSRRDEGGVEVLRLPRLPEGRLRRRAFEPHLVGHAALAHPALFLGGDDVIHAFHLTSALAATNIDKPVVLSLMGVPDRASMVATRNRLRVIEHALALADAVTVLSHAAAAACERWLGVEPRVIHPGVDLEVFTPDPAARAAEPTILCAADPEDPRKRVPLLREAFALVRRERPDARLLLAEGGALDGGTGDPAAMAARYREAWVSVLPSVGEAFGLVLVEALACGTPVVGTRSGAIPEVVDRPEIGTLFDGDDPQALAHALLDALALAEHPATGAACRARAEDFPTTATAAAFEDVYGEVRARR